MRRYPHDVYRNNADLGKGVPRQHVSMKPRNSSFYPQLVRELIQSSICVPPPPESTVRVCVVSRESGDSARALCDRSHLGCPRSLAFGDRGWRRRCRKPPCTILLASCHRKESSLPAADFRNGECAFCHGCDRLFEEVAALPPVCSVLASGSTPLAVLDIPPAQRPRIDSHNRGVMPTAWKGHEYEKDYCQRLSQLPAYVHCFCGLDER